ncbi:MAG: hypothetical protein KTR31_37620 [Myxococcales bacterium]|nr:hypothetical protein [Myxococcales bacterium]
MATRRCPGPTLPSCNLVACELTLHALSPDSSELCTQSLGPTLDGTPGGLAAGDGRLYLNDDEVDRILVFE